jgi:phosphopantothenoylcysteine decarboxylase/phosphopantothenate--cysteine ligase
MSVRYKKILIGVTGGIAAYKAAILVRLLIKNGAEVKVIMTASALDFITPLTLATLAKGPVFSDFFDKKSGDWHNHVDLGLWADVFLIAPLSANTLSKMATGQSDNLLTATYLSARCPVVVAPAMDLDMYRHPAVTRNLITLKSHGVTVLDAGTGELASGLSGKGRMQEPEEIMDALSILFSNSDELAGKRLLVTAGPTQEAIDPVRYISNHSSGKMGLSIAHEAAKRGASVDLILGPTQLTTTHPNIHTTNVGSAVEMFEACLKIHPLVDIAIFSAAVADYSPIRVADQKLKKIGDSLVIELKKNVDIAESLGAQKRDHQVHVGFALETENETENATEKLKRKNFDLVVMNSLRDEGAGFQKDTNKVTYITAATPPQTSEVLPKAQIAGQILDMAVQLLRKPA